jgi:glucose-6-phosphate isomerase
VHFNPGLDITPHKFQLALDYGPDVEGPPSVMRRLEDIRPSLMNPACDGPDPVYGIAMDVYKRGDAEELRRRYLLFGVVVYAAGRLGDEPVRSQGHIHARAPHSGWSTPELFEIWEGRAVVYAQEFAEDDPGRCFAVEAGPGDQVVVPPCWAHCVINAGANSRMVFGALCERQYGFEYDAIRSHGGLAWFPLIGASGIDWLQNPRYRNSSLKVHRARAYPELGLDATVPIYQQYQQNHETLQWVSEPVRMASLWPHFEP